MADRKIPLIEMSAGPDPLSSSLAQFARRHAVFNHDSGRYDEVPWGLLYQMAETLNLTAERLNAPPPAKDGA